eukprot:g37915.t1
MSMADNISLALYSSLENLDNKGTYEARAPCISSPTPSRVAASEDEPGPCRPTQNQDPVGQLGARTPLVNSNQDPVGQLGARTPLANLEQGPHRSIRSQDPVGQLRTKTPSVNLEQGP